LIKSKYKIEYQNLVKLNFENITHYIRYNLQNKTVSAKLAKGIINNIKAIATFPYANKKYF